MSQQPSTAHSASVESSVARRVVLTPPQGMMLGWLAALLAARWLMPTEGAAEGLTL